MIHCNPNQQIVILMAVYNGQKFLKEQLDSIINQSFPFWKLIIRDDGSTDKTKEIIDEYSSRDYRIEIITCRKGRLGACANFSELLSYAKDYKYIAFCDQDDIWMKNKLETQMSTINEIEAAHGCDIPILLYGTYFFIDAEGNRIDLPVPDYSATSDFRYLMSHNCLYGCTMLINNKLYRYVCNIPHAAENHDYWIALIAESLKAKIQYIPEPLLLYRKHANNVSSNVYQSSFSARLKRFIRHDELIYMRRRIRMLDELLRRKQDIIDYNVLELTRGYIAAVHKGGIDIFLYCLKHRIRRYSFSKTLMFYINLLRLKKEQFD